MRGGELGGFDFDAEYGAIYDRIVRQVFPAYEDLHRIVVALLRDTLPDSARLLVVGAGSGTELRMLAEAEPRWRLTGIEPSPQMIGIARAKLARAGVDDRVTLHHGVTDELPPGEPFDAATLICVLHFLPDDGSKAALLRAIAERVRSAAPFVLVDAYGTPGTREHELRFSAWMRYIEQSGMTAEERATYRAQLDASVRWVDEARLRELLEEAGFEAVTPVYRALVFGGWIGRRR